MRSAGSHCNQLCVLIDARLHTLIFLNSRSCPITFNTLVLHSDSRSRPISFNTLVLHSDSAAAITALNWNQHFTSFSADDAKPGPDVTHALTLLALRNRTLTRISLQALGVKAGGDFWIEFADALKRNHGCVLFIFAKVFGVLFIPCPARARACARASALQQTVHSSHAH
jgi:hypothetical protein